MPDQQLPSDFIERLKRVVRKRPKAVIDHILEHGFVTTEELTTLYGYEHAPRAARGVREEGIPLDTFYVKNSAGRSIAAYRFGDLSLIRKDRIGGRVTFSKKFKQDLITQDGLRCAVCSAAYEDRYLQIDHRVPYEVAGEASTGDRKLSEYMLLCGSCNRAKSWSCEHCENWLIEKKPELCGTCYWASPQDYQHIALRFMRRLEVVWNENEIADYEQLKQRAQKNQVALPEVVKDVLKSQLKETGNNEE
jgi:5-methylcytosine-specific restriction endonuclease McrA